MKRLLCLILRHQPPPGVSRAWSMRFMCQRCGRVVDGDLSRAVRR